MVTRDGVDRTLASGWPVGPSEVQRRSAVFAQTHADARAARIWAAEVLRSSAVLRDRVDDAVLVVGELMTNAVRHADPGPIVVSLVVSGDGARIEVRDAGGGQVQFDPTGQGVGLRMVELAADGWDVDADGHGKTVRAHFARR